MERLYSDLLSELRKIVILLKGDEVGVSGSSLLINWFVDVEMRLDATDLTRSNLIT